MKNQTKKIKAFSAIISASVLTSAIGVSSVNAAPPASGELPILPPSSASSGSYNVNIRPAAVALPEQRAENRNNRNRQDAVNPAANGDNGNAQAEMPHEEDLKNEMPQVKAAPEELSQEEEIQEEMPQAEFSQEEEMPQEEMPQAEFSQEEEIQEEMPQAEFQEVEEEVEAEVAIEHEPSVFARFRRLPQAAFNFVVAGARRLHGMIRPNHDLPGEAQGEPQGQETYEEYLQRLENEQNPDVPGDNDILRDRARRLYELASRPNIDDATVIEIRHLLEQGVNLNILVAPGEYPDAIIDSVAFRLDMYNVDGYDDCTDADNRVEVIKLLLEHGANPNGNFRRYTPLYHALSAKKYELVQPLLSRNADVSARSQNLPVFYRGPRHATGKTSAMDLVEEQLKSSPKDAKLQEIKELLEAYDAVQKAKRETQNEHDEMSLWDGRCLPGSRKLFWLVKNATTADVEEYLRECGTRYIIATDDFGRTPLHYAMERALHSFDFEMVDLLLSKGADLRFRDRAGITPEVMFVEARGWSYNQWFRR